MLSLLQSKFNTGSRNCFWYTLFLDNHPLDSFLPNSNLRPVMGSHRCPLDLQRCQSKLTTNSQFPDVESDEPPCISESDIQDFSLNISFWYLCCSVCCVGASYICKYSGNQSQWTNWNDWKERVSIGRQMRGLSLVSCYMIKPSHWLIVFEGAWTDVMVWWNVIATENNNITILIQKIQGKKMSVSFLTGIISVPDTKFWLTSLALGRLSFQSFLMNNYSTEN